jgi:hypothetical protein
VRLNARRVAVVVDDRQAAVDAQATTSPGKRLLRYRLRPTVFASTLR